MGDYSKTVIYLLYSETDPRIYVGSSIQFEKRCKNHVLNDGLKESNKKAEFIREIGVDNVKFLELEHFPCHNEDEKLLREKFWYDRLRPNLNSMAPCLTPEERPLKHKENNKKIPTR